MDGIDTGMTSALTALSATQAGSEVQVKVLKEAMDQAEQGLLPLLEHLGQGIDVRG